MPKTKISEYSATANSNTDVASINIDEGCAPSGINNAIRAIMGHLKDFQSGTSNDPFTVGSSGSLTLSYGTANGVAYLNGSKVVTTGSALVFDGTTFTAGTATGQNGVFKTVIGSGGANEGVVIVSGTTGTGWLGFNNGNNANIPGQVTYNHSTGALSLYANGGPVIFSASGAEGMRLTSTGLGIGNTSPASYNSAADNLVIGTSGSNGMTIVSGSTSSGYIMFADGTTGQQAYEGQITYDHTNNFMAFNTSGTERARIDSSGNLLVGKTNTTGVNAGAVLTPSGGFTITRTGTSASDQVIFYRGTAGSEVYVGTITTTGTATSYVTSSDYRLKNTIAPMTGALAKVAALKPVTYKWNADGSDGEGFIAHELAEVVPQCVTGEKDAVDEDGNPKYQGIDTSFLVATLTAAIQELKAEFDAYKASHP